jgi:hypothetical protein
LRKTMVLTMEEAARSIMSQNERRVTILITSSTTATL